MLLEKNRDLGGTGSFKNINIPKNMQRGVSGKLSEKVMSELEGEVFLIQEKVDKVEGCKMDN